MRSGQARLIPWQVLLPIYWIAVAWATLRALVEMGLRLVLEQSAPAQRPFSLRKASFPGQGLQPGVQDSSWDELRDLSYGDRLR